jgi:hypothetical protein
MAHDAKAQRGERPFVFTNLKTGEGLDAVISSSARRGCCEPDEAKRRRGWGGSRATLPGKP